MFMADYRGQTRGIVLCGRGGAETDTLHEAAAMIDTMTNGIGRTPVNRIGETVCARDNGAQHPSAPPSTNGDNGAPASAAAPPKQGKDGRDARGRFARGNAGGAGKPVARRCVR